MSLNNNQQISLVIVQHFTMEFGFYVVDQLLAKGLWDPLINEF